MIFFLVMPGLFGGFGNYIMPVFLGAPEVVYPRINNISILILPLSYFITILCVAGEFSNGTGWTLYTLIIFIHGIIRFSFHIYNNSYKLLD